MTPSKAVLDRLERLIAFPTVSRDSNLGLIEWVRDELGRQGVESRLTYDDERRKANLFATIGASKSGASKSGASQVGGLVLSGHTDVVPVDGQDWKTDPFRAVIADDRVYGRGSADMKGFIAVVLAAVPEMLARVGDRAGGAFGQSGGPMGQAGGPMGRPGRPMGQPIHIALSYDEEVGCLGAPRLIDDFRAAGIQPARCVVGEPTSMRLVNGHKGGVVHRCRVRGRAAHSALAPQGVNAISYAALLIARLREIAQRLQMTEAPDVGYDVPHTTLNVGVISGGIASNIVAESCEFRVDIRHLPYTSPQAIVEELRAAAEELLVEMRAIAPEAAITFERVGGILPLATDAGAAIVTEVSRALGTTEPATKVGFGTEAGLFDAAGVATVICGPGSIEQAHKPNEFVTLEQLARCEQFVRALIDGAPQASAQKGAPHVAHGRGHEELPWSDGEGATSAQKGAPQASAQRKPTCH
jgi:acetylornithine deacetylase